MIVKPPFVKTSISPSTLLPLYSHLVKRRPLPTNPSLFAGEDEDQDAQRQDSGSDQSEEEESFITPSQSRKRTKKHKKRRSRTSSESEDSDREPSRNPLAESIHANRQAQRANHHPSMTKPRHTKNSNKQARDDAEGLRLQAEKENEALKLEMLRLKKRMKLDKSGSNGPAISGTDKAMQREVTKTAKQQLWKICKFIKNDAKLMKATKFVMEQMELVELQGLEGAKLVDAQETWKKRYCPSVRTAINKMRNYVQQVSSGDQYVTMLSKLVC